NQVTPSPLPAASLPVHGNSEKRKQALNAYIPRFSKILEINLHRPVHDPEFRITVIDLEPPEFDPMDDIVTEIEPGMEGIIVTWDEPLVTDNCGVESVTSNFEPGDFFPVGETEVTYLATDVHGNNSEMEFIIKVSDEGLDIFEADTPGSKTAFFKIYPNPSTGQFTLELKNVELSRTITVEIISLLGNNILYTKLPGMKHHVFDMSERQPGIYLIRVKQGDQMGIEELILQ
ncbi:MAG: HYR domain-containing protein, partial [Bacteroidales bacterium]